MVDVKQVFTRGMVDEAMAAVRSDGETQVVTAPRGSIAHVFADPEGPVAQLAERLFAKEQQVRNRAAWLLEAFRLMEELEAQEAPHD